MTIEQANEAVKVAARKVSDKAMSVYLAKVEDPEEDFSQEDFEFLMSFRRGKLAKAKETLSGLERGAAIEGSIKDAIQVDTKALENLALANGNDIEESLNKATSEYHDKVKRLILGRTRRSTGSGVAPPTAKHSEARGVFAQLLGQSNALDLMRSSRGRTKFLTPLSEWGVDKKVTGQYATAEVNGETYIYRKAVTEDNLEYLKGLIQQ